MKQKTASHLHVRLSAAQRKALTTAVAKAKKLFPRATTRYTIGAMAETFNSLPESKQREALAKAMSEE